MKTHRFSWLCLWYSIVCLSLPSLGRASSKGDGGLNFDAVTTTSLPPTFYPGVTFASGLEVTTASTEWWNVHTISPDKVVIRRGPGGIGVDFGQNVNYARVYVGNPARASKCTVEIRAYGGPGKLTLLGAVRRSLNTTDVDIVQPLEITRLAENDIGYIVVEYLASDYSTFDSLQAGTYTPANSTTVNFDQTPVGTPIEANYPGVMFSGATRMPRVTAAASLGVSTQSRPNLLQADVSTLHEFLHPEKMVVTFNPPQAFVHVRVGSPNAAAGGAVRYVTMTAYADAARTRTVGEAYVRYPAMPAYSIVDTLALSRLNQCDIAAVDIAYTDAQGGTYREVIDDLVFGPLVPGSTVDNDPPVIRVVTPQSGLQVRQPGPASPTGLAVVSGTVAENTALAELMIHASGPSGGVITTPVTPSRISATEYSFNGSAVLSVGENRIWVTARDLAGNSASTEARPILVTYDRPHYVVTSVSPLVGNRAYQVRRAGFGAQGSWQDALSYGEQGRVITIVGQNFGSEVYVRMNAAGTETWFRPPMTIAPDGTSIRVTLSDDVLGAGNSSWNLQVVSTWPFPSIEVVWNGLYRVVEPEYPVLQGFGFLNPNEPVQAGEFFSAFGWNTYWGWPWCARGPLARKIYWPAYELIMTKFAASGSCVGMSATSLLLARGYNTLPQVNPNRNNPAAQYYFPAGITGEQPTATYQWPDCDPPHPDSLTGFIRMNHAVQLSAEVVNVVMDQIGFARNPIRFWGSPADRIDQIRYTPTDYILSICTLRGTNFLGHALTPYRVEADRIYVYDSNHPYDHTRSPSDPVNQHATTNYIQIDRTSNEYFYPTLGWRGNLMFALPIEIWERPRTSVGLGEILRGGIMYFAGSADASYSSPDGQSQFGWQTDGTFAQNFEGAAPYVLMNGPEDGMRNPPIVFPSGIPDVVLDARLTGGEGYSFVSAQSGRTVSLSSLDGGQGVNDRLQLSGSSLERASLTFTPGRDGVRFVATVGGNHGQGREESVSFGGLALDNGLSCEFGAPFSGGADIVNRSGRNLNPLVLATLVDTNGANTQFVFGPVQVSSGARVLSVLQTNTMPPQLEVLEDTDDNGTWDRTTRLDGRSVRIQDNPGDQDLNLNGIIDSVDVAFGGSADANRNGIPDDAETPGSQITTEDGNWVAKEVILTDTAEAQLMVRSGDIDNLGFGWEPGFNPFSGQSTPPHGFPWEPTGSDPTGTDLIMVPSSYIGQSPFGEDGYTTSTTRPGNQPQTIQLNYQNRLGGRQVTRAILQLFVDDFQAPIWGSHFTALLNGRRAPFIERTLNALSQTGPIGKLVTIEVPAEFYPDVASGSLSLLIDDYETGAGDGYAIDFVKLLINPVGTLFSGTVRGTVIDGESGAPLPEAIVSVGDNLTTKTDGNGAYTLLDVPAGLAVINASVTGYTTGVRTVDLPTGQTVTADFGLQHQLLADGYSAVSLWPGQALLGEAFHVTVTAGNGGPNPATSATLAIRLPVGATAANLTTSMGQTSQVGDEIVVPLGDLGGSSSLTVSFDLTPSNFGTYTVTARFTSTRADPDESNNFSESSGQVVAHYGRVFVTSQDPDYHANPANGPEANGAQSYLRKAVNYATSGNQQPRLLLIAGRPGEGGANSDTRLGLSAAGLVFDVAASAGEPVGVDQAVLESYDAVIVASDAEGSLYQGDMDMLNNRAYDIVNYLNRGGGLLVLGESRLDNRFGFVPGRVSSTALNQEAGDFTLTPVGETIGFVPAEITGNPCHGYLAIASGYRPSEYDGQGRVISMAMEDHYIIDPRQILTSADLRVSANTEPHPARVDQDIVYRYEVVNQGPGDATGLTAAIQLPADFLFVSGTPAHGSLSPGQDSNGYTWSIPYLGRQETAQCEILVRAKGTGSFTNRISVSAVESDPHPEDNSAQRVHVVSAANLPPQVTIVEPVSGAVSLAGQAILITADPVDADDGVAGVDFYASGQLLGSAKSSPYRVTWENLAVGDYKLLAVAHDQAGATAMSEPVLLRVVERQPNGRVAILTPDEGTEAAALQVWLNELNLGSDLFVGSKSTISELYNFSLAIWSARGKTGQNAVTANAVQLLDRLTSMGVPTYLIGDELANGANLSEIDLALWQQLISIKALSDTLSGSTLHVMNTQHPVINGPYGVAADMKVYGPAMACIPVGQTSVALAEIDQSVVLVARDRALTGVPRSLAQSFLAAGGNDTANEARLFKNAVSWLLGEVPPQHPVLTIHILGRRVVVSWTEPRGQLQKSTDLSSGKWTDLGAPQISSYQEDLGTTPAFYRVIVR